MYTNKTNIPISLAVWLCNDDYDHNPDTNVISATTLLKPLKSIILARQNMDLDKIADVSSLIPSRMGTALHTAVEDAWKDKEKLIPLLKSLGYNDEVIDKILINPDPEEIKPESICIYMEQRAQKASGKYYISGKFDFVIEGRLEDFKSTGTYNYISGSNKEKYRQQGSIYRWLNPDIITNDVMTIQYIFTDWSSLKARTDKNYPSGRLVEQKIPLMSLAETESFINAITKQIAEFEHTDQDDLPPCTSEELWAKPDVFKYYKDPAKRARSTKNFPTYQEAAARLAKDGSVGIIDTVKGQVVRCRYCDVSGICNQAASYIADGTLVL